MAIEQPCRQKIYEDRGNLAEMKKKDDHSGRDGRGDLRKTNHEGKRTRSMSDQAEKRKKGP